MRDYAGLPRRSRQVDRRLRAQGCRGAHVALLHRVFLGTNPGTEHVIDMMFDEQHEYIEGIAAFSKALANLHGDIGIAPLGGDDFDRCKSELHWLEYAMTDMAFIGQRFAAKVPTKVVRDGVDGLLARGAQEWHDGSRRSPPQRTSEMTGWPRQRARPCRVRLPTASRRVGRRLPLGRRTPRLLPVNVSRPKLLSAFPIASKGVGNLLPRSAEVSPADEHRRDARMVDPNRAHLFVHNDHAATATDAATVTRRASTTDRGSGATADGIASGHRHSSTGSAAADNIPRISRPHRADSPLTRFGGSTRRRTTAWP
jgi:hypothetical protein